MILLVCTKGVKSEEEIEELRKKRAKQMYDDMKVAISKKANLNKQHQFGATYLHVAAVCGYVVGGFLKKIELTSSSLHFPTPGTLKWFSSCLNSLEPTLTCKILMETPHFTWLFFFSSTSASCTLWPKVLI